MTKSALFLAAALPLLFAGQASAATDVPVGKFRGVQLFGGGHLVIRYGASQRVRLVKGSTEHTTFTIKHGTTLSIEACNWTCPHSYELEVEITTPEITALVISGGGEIESQGNFPRQKDLSVAVHGGGDVDSRAIVADNVSAAVNGGGDIKVRAEKSLSAAVNGGGDITFWGHPAISSAVRGGGEINRGS